MGPPLEADRDPMELLPLTDLAFNILVSLKDRHRHGYALIKELRVRTGRRRLRTGTVYAALARLEEAGLVAEVEDPDEPDDEDARRRYYGLTDLGVEVARAEARRLQEILELARSKELLPKTGRAP